MIRHHAPLRDVTGQSHPIYVCTRANHARYLSVQVMFCGSWEAQFIKVILRKNLDR